LRRSRSGCNSDQLDLRLTKAIITRNEITKRLRQRTDQPPADTKGSEFLIINFVLFESFVVKFVFLLFGCSFFAVKNYFRFKTRR
jgi:hypothetical protein